MAYGGALGRSITRLAYNSRRLTEVCESMDLNDWEQGFISSIVGSWGRGYHASNRQNEILERILSSNGTSAAEVRTHARVVQSIDEQLALVRRHEASIAQGIDRESRRQSCLDQIALLQQTIGVA
jgi:dynactin complex subunit